MDGSENSLQPSVFRHSEVALALGLLGVLVVLIVPLPTVLLDMCLASNLAIAVLLLLITISVAQPLELSVFPSLLLLLTLARLSLNVGTTRLILLNGDAGRIVSTFGDFVVGGNLVVGLVIFLILIVIQFIVITKGSSRISEVAARFRLDALPGKQMAIDAELNSGALTEEKATARRAALERETEFYGAMDGAGKFVRGDAIAGLVITGINIVGGIVIGVMNGRSVWDAVMTYSVLTVGDGLVSQIPALIIALSAGILITKATSDTSLGGEIGQQLLASGRPLILGAVILASVAMIPGFPKMPFALIAASLVFVSRRIKPHSSTDSDESEGDAKDEESTTDKHVDEFLQTDRVRVEIGVRLIPLVSLPGGNGLADRIATLRKTLTEKHGIWVPAIRVRDSLQLKPDEYRILINGREVARYELKSHSLMVIGANASDLGFDGEPTTDPAFGLKALWIPEDFRSRAEMKGMTVVDPPTVLITHLGEILRKLAHELLGREDLNQLLEKVKQVAPSVVEELKADESIRMSDVHQVLSLLLKEKIPLTNLTRILEAILQNAGRSKTPEEIAESVRGYLGRDIFDRLRNPDGSVSVVILNPRIEMRFKESMSDGRILLPHDALERLLRTLDTLLSEANEAGVKFAVLTEASLRLAVRKLLERSLPDVPVVTFNEVPPDMAINVTHVVKYESVFGTETNVDNRELSHAS